jgi:dTDP-4-dehydrorhamnose 3,5-epimerase-like enzyme
MRLIDGGLSIDDRGIVSFVNDFDFKDVKRFYMVQNHSKGFVRAWHGHWKEGKYVLVIKGTALIGVVNMTSGEPEKFILSDLSPKILYIPPEHANGFKTLTEDTRIMFFSTSTLEESKNDDLRYPANKWDIWGVDWR